EVRILAGELRADRLSTLLERVGDVLQEHESEDHVFVLAGVHGAAELVRRLPQGALEVLGGRGRRSGRRRGHQFSFVGGGDGGGEGPRRHGLGEFVLELVEGRELSVEVGASLLTPLRGGLESGYCVVRNGAQGPGGPGAAGTAWHVRVDVGT